MRPRKKPVKILVFTEGTIIKHVGSFNESAHDFASYVPIGNAVEKLNIWKGQGADISYLTSRIKRSEIEQITKVLKKHGFPEGQLFFRRKGEDYKDVAERIVPDILVEDDCRSIGGMDEMTITQVRPDIKRKIISIVVKEFEGIDNLPDNIATLSIPSKATPKSR